MDQNLFQMVCIMVCVNVRDAEAEWPFLNEFDNRVAAKSRPGTPPLSFDEDEYVEFRRCIPASVDCYVWLVRAVGNSEIVACAAMAYTQPYPDESLIWFALDVFLAYPRRGIEHFLLAQISSTPQRRDFANFAP